MREEKNLKRDLARIRSSLTKGEWGQMLMIKKKWGFSIMMKAKVERNYETVHVGFIRFDQVKEEYGPKK